MEKYPENIQLSGLYITPNFQKQGYGRELVQWGVQNLKEEGLVLGVESVEAPRPFYNKCGFEVVDSVVIRKEGEEAHVNMYVYLYKEPTH